MNLAYSLPWMLFALLFALLLALPAASLLALTLAAPRPRRADEDIAPYAQAARWPLAVLVPAHNESVNLLPTLANLKSQLGPEDRLLVVADNCSDDTACVAEQAGAEVLVRNDVHHRGKGYALAHGVNALRAAPPAAVMVVDADCTLGPGSLDLAARAAVASGRPVQLLNLMQCPPGASVRHRLLEFAMRMKNHTRALGSSRLGGSCHLMGTGMALPWPLAAQAELATGHVAEDMRLGTDLAVAGHTTLLLPQGSVHSAFPVQAADAHVQKSRWEHGHLATMREQLPRLLMAGLRRRDIGLLVLALDLCIPPLALYALLLGGALATGLLAAIAWPLLWPALAVLAGASLALTASVALCWHGYARQLLSAHELMSAVAYVFWKAPIYLAYVLRRQSGWIRAKRASAS